MYVIVVGVDGSAHADVALRWALQQARSAGAELYLVYAYGRRLGTDGSDDGHAAADNVLASIVDHHRAALGAVPWRAHAQSYGRGSPTHVLLDEAQQADLIVVGSRGLGGFGELILGSTSYRLVCWARIPVAVIRTDPSKGPSADPPAKGFVVGIDGSDTGDRALRWAAAEARRREVPLEVVHSQPLPMHHVLGMAAVPSMERERELVRQEGAQILARALDRAAEALEGLEVRRQARVGPPADALAVVAGTDHVLVVGNRGHSYVRGVMLGSVSHQVLHHAHGPVVVVP
ncbi:MAG TPA: universal stress protein [Euzebyales bacterium]|nr:universal stress protein [Euzebyales bacterium]